MSGRENEDGARPDGPESGETVAYDESDAGDESDDGAEDETPLADLAGRFEADDDPLPVAESRTADDLEPASTDATDVDDPEAREPDRDGRDGPLGDLAAAVRERGDGTTGFEDRFDRESVRDIDSDALWEQIERDDFAIDADLAGREVREIDTQTYCHTCEYLTDPPAVGCTHEGTDIVELVSFGTVRVADCPKVLEDERLEREAGAGGDGERTGDGADPGTDAGRRGP